MFAGMRARVQLTMINVQKPHSIVMDSVVKAIRPAASFPFIVTCYKLALTIPRVGCGGWPKIQL